MAQPSLMRARVVHRPDGAAPTTASVPIVATGTRIGRGAECDLVLDDALRLVSRQHAWLAPRDADSVQLKCISSSLALQVNGQPLPPGGECVVRAGDRLRLGGFEVLVEIDAVPLATPAPFEAIEAVLTMPTPTAAARTPAPARAASRLDRWFDLDHVDDPLGPRSPLPQPGAGQPSEGAVPAAPPAPAPLTVAATSAVARAAAMPGEAAARAFDESLLRAARAAAAAVAPAPAPVPAATVAAAQPAAAPDGAPTGPGEASPQALKRAFLRGAGLQGESAFVVDELWMEHIGALLRCSTDGTLALLRSRAVAKRNIRAENTQIVARENNPLKFAPDGAQALMLLLHLHSRRGFLEPVAAMRDAHADLQVHQVAMMAGMRAALYDLVLRLGPEATEAAEGPPHGLAQSVPTLRDAALWRRHKLCHERLLHNLDDLFEAVFGREFLKAYEAQSKLGAASADDPPADAAA